MLATRTSVERAALLFAVLAVALLHPLFQARVRPLYQVSDEMAYLRAAQLEALPGAAPASAACIAPPDGLTLEVGSGGKRGFRVATGMQLAWLCRHGGNSLPLFALRAANAITLPLMALAAWYLARRLSGRSDAGLVAALVVGIHPVAAKYAGGVTPDAWANVFSAGVLVGLTRIAIGGHRWWDVWAVTACALAGLLWKDTAHMLVPLAALSMVLAIAQGLARRGAGRGGGRQWPVAVALSIAVVCVVGVVRYSDALLTPYIAEIPEGRASIGEAPYRFVTQVLQDVIVNADGSVASSVRSLYRPLVYGPGVRAGQPLTPDAATALIVVLVGLGILGCLLHWVRPDEGQRRMPMGVLAVWALAVGLAFVQPSIRQVLLDINGLHQGRWLFPALTPVAAIVGIGLARLGGPSGRGLPLVVMAGLASMWLVVLDLVRHYYLAFPDRLLRSVLFTRPTGDLDIGDDAVLRLIEQTMTAQNPLMTWGILVLLVVASLGLVVIAIRHVLLPSPHV